MAKNRNISLRVSEEDYNRIKEKADSRNFTVSRYMTDMALSEDSFKLRAVYRLATFVDTIFFGDSYALALLIRTQSRRQE